MVDFFGAQILDGSSNISFGTGQYLVTNTEFKFEAELIGYSLNANSAGWIDFKVLNSN